MGRFESLMKIITKRCESAQPNGHIQGTRLIQTAVLTKHLEQSTETKLEILGIFKANFCYRRSF